MIRRWQGFFQNRSIVFLTKDKYSIILYINMIESIMNGIMKSDILVKEKR